MWKSIILSVSPWKDSFILYPILSMIMNALLASLLCQATNNNVVLLEQGIRMMGLVSNASISIVTLTFSLTVLSVQIAAQSYSPRLLDEFLKDPVSKIVISTNLGSYAYCFTINYFLKDGLDESEVPYLAIHFLTVHISIVLISFVNFIHFFINGFRIEKILSRAKESALKAAKSLNDDIEVVEGLLEAPDVPAKAFKVLADTSGYVTRFRLSNLLNQAVKMDLCIRYNHQIGDYVNRGTVLAYVWDAESVKLQEKSNDDESTLPIIIPMRARVIENITIDGYVDDPSKSMDERVEKRLGVFVSNGISIEDKRSSDLDISLGVQQLADIAIRALSPGVNDPFTAIQCMDVLTAVLATLARSDMPIFSIKDSDGTLRACAPRRTFSYLLSMLDGIRIYGATDVSVCRRALRMLGDLASILLRSDRIDRIPACLIQIDEWMNVSRRNFAKGSPELKLLESLTDHILRDVSDSHNMKVKDTSKVRDLQEFETTISEELGQNDKIVKDQLKRISLSK